MAEDKGFMDKAKEKLNEMTGDDDKKRSTEHKDNPQDYHEDRRNSENSLS